MIKSTILVLLFTLLAMASAQSKTICSMTFNSQDERDVFRKVFPHDTHIELVTSQKDPDWFKKACQRDVHCDVLLLSGHFGGMFFGEKSSSLLSLEELETAKCAKSCENILNAKEIYLMGCNTLATKTPDHRSIEEYLKVLVQDGFPRNMAEEVVASRYVNYGLGMSERMSLAFRSSARLFGFASTGPLGAAAGPKLEKALRGNPSVSIENRLSSAFSGTSFRIVNPLNEISGTDASLQCQARATSMASRSEAYRKIIDSDDLRRHFDLILRNVHDRAVSDNLKQAGQDRHLSQKMESLVQSILEKGEVLIGATFQALTILHTSGLISSDEYQDRIYQSLEKRLNQGLDPISLDQVCSIAQDNKDLIFQSRWIKNAKVETQSYWARLYSCFSLHDEATGRLLKTWLYQTLNSSLRREVLRALSRSWTEEEKVYLKSLSRNWSLQDQHELSFSLQESMKVVCQGLPDDNSAWNCFNSHKNSFSNIRDCQNATSGFSTEMGLGADWYCLQTFPEEIQLSVCLKAGDKYQNAEKADDFLQYCWDRLREKNQINRSECMGLGQAMRIPGNRIKQNWNCMNQIKDF